jgi:hypothetical protein
LNGKKTDLKKPNTHRPPDGISFSEYTKTYLRELHQIAHWLGKGEGLRLQREDSDLAISVLRKLNEMSIVALPVHDSFIVMEGHRHYLHRAMRECFMAAHGVEPEIR